jgi:hypothetical protein
MNTWGIFGEPSGNSLETFWEHSGNRLGPKKKQKIYRFKAGIDSSPYQYSNQYCIAKLHLI